MSIDSVQCGGIDFGDQEKENEEKKTLNFTTKGSGTFF